MNVPGDFIATAPIAEIYVDEGRTKLAVPVDQGKGFGGGSGLQGLETMVEHDLAHDRTDQLIVLGYENDAVDVHVRLVVHVRRNTHDSAWFPVNLTATHYKQLN
jgi:hypothetical protein